MSWNHVRTAALSAALLAATAGFGLAQTANDGSHGMGGSPGATAGQTPSATGNVSNPGAPPRSVGGAGMTNGAGVHDPRHTGNGPTVSNGWAGEAPSSAPERQ